MAYGGKSITYDVLSCPTNYLGKTILWDNTGSLTAIGNTGIGTIRYIYLSDGQRRTKTVNGKTTTYRYNNGMLLSEQTGDGTLRYYYDATGKITSLTYKKGSNAEVNYFYTRNLQGDIIAIYRSSDSKLIGTYEYDLWGRPVSVTEATKGIDTDAILTKNPFRYRGYYYDAETGFYNLNARYYDPEIRRFISADDMKYLGVEDEVSGYNLFAYCGNNPVMGYDPTGNWDWGGVIAGAGIIGLGVGAAILGGPLSAAGAVAIGYVIYTGGVTCYAAATDSVMVVDVSGAFGVPIYGKGGNSAVIDFENDNVNLYSHFGLGIGFQCGPSIAVGLVENYEKPDDYAGPFIGGNMAFCLGVDHCWDPRAEYDLATKATSITFSSGPSFGFGFNYFSDPLQILEW